MNNLIETETLFDSFDHGILVLDKDCIVYTWNKWLQVHTGILAQDIIGKSLEEFFIHINYKTLKRKLKTSLQLNTPTFYDPSNKKIFIPIKRTTIISQEDHYMKQNVLMFKLINSVDKIMVTISDVSELFEAKESLNKELVNITKLNKKLKDDKEIIDENIMILKTSLSGDIIEVSKLFCNFFEYNPEDLIGQKVSILKSGNLAESNYKELWSTILNQKVYSGELENITKNGKYIWVNIRISPIMNENGDILQFNAVYQDIINKKMLEQLYITDSLTQIYNRVYFDEKMEYISTHQRKNDTDFVIIIADIDHFKNVNDTYGHQFGDIALKSVAQTIKNSLRENDVVARWGGEEFVIMLKHVSVEQAEIIIDTIRKKIAGHTIDDTLALTVSFGLTKYILGEKTDETFKRADDALYEAKDTGRNKVVIKL